MSSGMSMPESQASPLSPPTPSDQSSRPPPTEDSIMGEPRAWPYLCPCQEFRNRDTQSPGGYKSPGRGSCPGDPPQKEGSSKGNWGAKSLGHQMSLTSPFLGKSFCISSLATIHWPHRYLGLL